MAGPGETAQISTFESGQTPPNESRPLITVAVLAAAVAALYFLRDIFIPIALAVLLSFMLGPAVTRLRRWGVGRVSATLLVVTLAGLLIAGITTVVAIQVVDDTGEEVPIPGQPYGFGRLIRAQAAGDFASLQERGRRVARVRLEEV